MQLIQLCILELEQYSQGEVQTRQLYVEFDE